LRELAAGFKDKQFWHQGISGTTNQKGSSFDACQRGNNC
jgi:hypothetical protein